MKLFIYVIIILQVFTLSANANVIPSKIQDSSKLIVDKSNIAEVTNLSSCYKSSTSNVDQNNIQPLDSLSFALSAICDVITWSSVLIATITLLVAAFGYFGYNRMENRIKNRISELDKKQAEFNDYISQMKVIQDKLLTQGKYICNSNVYIYDTLDKIANQIVDAEKGKLILERMYHNYQIINLYATDNNLKFASLAYMENNGTQNDIKHLEHVATYDDDEKNRIRAREIIGIIKHKRPV